MKAKEYVPEMIYGLFSILFLTSLVGVSLTGLLDKETFSVLEFRTGLQVFFATPTTVNMGVVLTEQAGGNVILSLILTVVANIIGIFTVPLMLGMLVDFDNMEVPIPQHPAKVIPNVSFK